MIIRIILIVAALTVGVLLARGGGARYLALRRLGVLAAAIAAIASIIEPELWTRAARLVGVGRGTDLLLYVLVVASLLYLATRTARDRRTSRELTELARAIALAGAPPPEPSGEVAGSPVAGSQVAGEAAGTGAAGTGAAGPEAAGSKAAGPEDPDPAAGGSQAEAPE
jgi:hypothetical protein